MFTRTDEVLDELRVAAPRTTPCTLETNRGLKEGVESAHGTNELQARKKSASAQRGTKILCGADIPDRRGEKHTPHRATR